MHEGLDQHDLALVPGRVLPELAAGVEIKPLDQALQIRLVDSAAQVREVLEDLPTREIGIQRGLAGYVADQPLHLDGLPPAVEARDPRRAGIGAEQRHQDANRRGLACTVGAEKAEHLTFPDLERDVDDAPLVAITLGKPLDFDDRCRHLLGLLRLQRSMIPVLSRSQNSCTSTISFIRRLAFPGPSSDSARFIALSESRTRANVPVNVDSISSVAS